MSIRPQSSRVSNTIARNCPPKPLYPEPPLYRFFKNDEMPVLIDPRISLTGLPRGAAAIALMIIATGVVFPQLYNQFHDNGQPDNNLTNAPDKLEIAQSIVDATTHTLSNNPAIAAYLSDFSNILSHTETIVNDRDIHIAAQQVINVLSQLGDGDIDELREEYSLSTLAEQLRLRQQTASLLRKALEHGELTPDQLCTLTGTDDQLYPIRRQIQLLVAEIFGIRVQVESELLPAQVMQDVNGNLTLSVTDPDTEKTLKTFSIQKNGIIDGTVKCKGDIFVLSLPDAVLQSISNGDTIDITSLTDTGNQLQITTAINNDTLGTDQTNNYKKLRILSSKGGYIIIMSESGDYYAITRTQLKKFVLQLAKRYELPFDDKTSIISLLSQIKQKLEEARAVSEEQHR